MFRVSGAKGSLGTLTALLTDMIDIIDITDMRLSSLEIMHELGIRVHATWRLEGHMTFTRIQGIVTEFEAAYLCFGKGLILSSASVDVEVTMLIRGIRSCASWQYLGDKYERTAGAFTASCVAMLWLATCHHSALHEDIPSYLTHAVHQNSPHSAFADGANVIFRAVRDFV